MRSDDQPLLPMKPVRPEGPPLRVVLAVDRFGFATQAGSKSLDPSIWDRSYPNCAPHYLATFLEIVE